MKFSAQEQASVVTLMTRIYEDIRAVEELHGLIVGGGDLRPRIEYFHDAVRAVTSQNHARLSVELLAYDLSCLRYVQSMPLASFKTHGAVLGKEVITRGEKDLAIKTKKPDRNVKNRLSELYQHYAVLFAALLKPAADRDHRDRVEEMNDDVRTLNSIRAGLEGKISIAQIQTLLEHVSDDVLRKELQTMLKNKKPLPIKAMVAQKDKTIAGVDAAHMNYALAQLAIFEESKDLLKKLAGQGTNLVGNFVANAMAETRAQMGR